MTKYLALARKWRPHTFTEIVGQSHVVTALQNALALQKIHHAYLLTGTHGVGKTTLARILAKSLNCESGITPNACNECAHCREIDAGRFPDLYEIDAASRTKVEDTRELLDNVPYAPTKGRFKVYLIDEVHMLSGHSFNALLKTLEEPPEHVKFLLATTDPQKLPATVLSRCLQFHLSQLLPEQIEAQLAHILKQENIPFEIPALALLSQAANGSMRDGLSLLDQCIAFCNGHITTTETQKMLGISHQADTITLLQAIDRQDAQTALSLTKTWAQNGVNFSQALTTILTELHTLATAQILKTQDPSAASFSPENIQLYYQIALLGQKDLPLAPNPRVGFEMIVIRMMAFQPNDTENQAVPPQKAQAKQVTSAKQSVSMADHNAWRELLNQLSITGPTLAFAQQCSLNQQSEESLTLYLNPQYKALYNERHKMRLQEALKNYFHRDIQVIIEIKDSTAQTPAQITQQEQEAKKQSAKKAINADPTVQRIMQQFDATILEDSIEPL